MKPYLTLLLSFLFAAFCLLSVGCGSAKKLQQKDAEINNLNRQIQDLKNNVADFEEEKNRLRDRADAADRRANDSEIQVIEVKKAQMQKRRTAAQTNQAHAKSECARAGDSFKRNDYQDITEHAARVLAALTAISALAELDDVPNPALATALAEAKREAEGLIEASGKKQHKDSHDHHEHLTGKLATIETLLGQSK